MQTCPRCGKEDCVKDGIVRGRQRWRCRACRYRHTVQQRGKDVHIKRQAVELYLDEVDDPARHVTSTPLVTSFRLPGAA